MTQRIITLSILLAIFVGAFVLVPTSVSAATPQPGYINNPFLGAALQNILATTGGVGFLRVILPNSISLAFIVGSIVFLFMLIFGAIQWMMAGSDKGAMEAARTKLANAIIGIIVLFCVYAIVSVVNTFFNLDILTIDIGALRI